MKRKNLIMVIALMLIVVLTGCVSQGDYDALQESHDSDVAVFVTTIDELRNQEPEIFIETVIEYETITKTVEVIKEVEVEVIVEVPVEVIKTVTKRVYRDSGTYTDAQYRELEAEYVALGVNYNSGLVDITNLTNTNSGLTVLNADLDDLVYQLSVKTSEELVNALVDPTVDFIYLADGTYEIDATTIDKDLTIVGESTDGVIINPLATATGNVFTVSEDATLNISNLTIDGENAVVLAGIYAYGELVVDNINIVNIKQSASMGFGIISKGELLVENSYFAGIQRVGIHTGLATENQRVIRNNTYIGTTTNEDKLDYAIEVGRDANVLIEGNTIIGNTATYDSSDPELAWGSAGILITSYFEIDIDVNPYAIVKDNNISNCSTAVYVGYEWPGTSYLENSHVVFEGNTFTDNTTDVYVIVDDVNIVIEGYTFE